MPKIQISENHNISTEELFTRIDDYMARLRDDKLKAMGFQYDWNSDKSGLKIKGKGFKGEASFSDSLVSMMLDLSFALSPFKGKIEESLKRGIKRVCE